MGPLNAYFKKMQPEHAYSGAEDRMDIPTSLLKTVMSILICELLAISADEDSKRILNEQYKGYNLLKNIANNYGSQCIATLCHELGHALAAKAINGDSINIHLGSNSDSSNSMLTFGGISIDGFDPRKGYSSHSAPHDNPAEVHATLDQLVRTAGDVPTRNSAPHAQHHNIQELIKQLKKSPAFQELKKNIIKINPTKQAIILLAGGIGGLLGRFATKAITHLIINRDRSSLQESCSQAITHALKPDHIYINQLMNMLVPFHVDGGHSDATKFWDECVGINQDFIQAIQNIAPGIELSGELYLAHAQAVSPHADNKTKALIGLLNYLVGGFIHVHV